MTETATSSTTYSVNINLPEAAANRVSSSKQELNTVASYLVSQYALGGIMVESSTVNTMAAYCSFPLRTQTDLMDIIEKAVNKRCPDGSRIISYKMDGAFCGQIEERARVQGRSVDALVQDCMHALFTNNWLYGMETSGGAIYLTKQQREEIESLMGQELGDGDWLVNALRKAHEEAKPELLKLVQHKKERKHEQEGAQA